MKTDGLLWTKASNEPAVPAPMPGRLRRLLYVSGTFPEYLLQIIIDAL